jgi:hypothetical protein
LIDESTIYEAELRECEDANAALTVAKDALVEELKVMRHTLELVQVELGVHRSRLAKKAGAEISTKTEKTAAAAAAAAAAAQKTAKVVPDKPVGELTALEKAAWIRKKEKRDLENHKGGNYDTHQEWDESGDGAPDDEFCPLVAKGLQGHAVKAPNGIVYQGGQFTTYFQAINRVEQKPDPPAGTRAPKLLCWIFTKADWHGTKALASKRAWGSKCDKLIFYSDTDDEELGAVALDLHTGTGDDP